MKTMTADRPWTGRTILVALVCIFGVVAAVNGIFIFFAVTTWPGLSQSDAYERGLRYNEVIRAARLQNDLGWQSAVTAEPSGKIRVRLAGPDDRPVAVSSASLTIERPVGDAALRSIALSKELDGTLVALSAPLSRGIWHLTLSAVGAAGESYRMRHVVEIAP